MQLAYLRAECETPALRVELYAQIQSQKNLPLMKVGPRFNIVSFNANPKSYWEMLPLVSLSEFNLKKLPIPDARILTVADAKETKTCVCSISKLILSNKEFLNQKRRIQSNMQVTSETRTQSSMVLPPEC